MEQPCFSEVRICLWERVKEKGGSKGNGRREKQRKKKNRRRNRDGERRKTRAVCEWEGQDSTTPWSSCQLHCYLTLFREVSKAQKSFVVLALRTYVTNCLGSRLEISQENRVLKRLTVRSKDQRSGTWGLICKKPSNCEDFSPCCGS